MIDGEHLKWTEHDLANPDVIGPSIDSCRTIAVVGLSDNPCQPSHRVAGLGACPSAPSLRGKEMPADAKSQAPQKNRRRI